MKLNIFKVLCNLFLAAFLFVCLSPFVGDSAALAFTGGLFALSFNPFGSPVQGSLFIGLQTEVWERDVQEALQPGNEFMDYCINNSDFVDSGNVVHRPQAGTQPRVTKNRTEYPAKIIKIKDTDETYQLDDYTTDPILITGAEEQWLSYDRRASVLQRHTDVLNTDIAQNLLQNWSPTLASSIIRTSGASDATGSNLAVGATGTRLKLVKEDIFKMAKLFDDRKVPSDGRYALLSTAQYYELFGDSNLALALAYGGKQILPTGVINQLAGFNLMLRPNLPVYSNAGTPGLKAKDAATAITDNLASLFWHKNFVDRALGSINIRINEERADMFGTIMSAQVFFGGAKMRQTTEIGVGTIVQAAG